MRIPFWGMLLASTVSLADGIQENHLGALQAIERVFPIDVEACLAAMWPSGLCTVRQNIGTGRYVGIEVEGPNHVCTYQIDERTKAKVYVEMHANSYSVSTMAERRALAEQESRALIKQCLESLPANSLKVVVFAVPSGT